MSGAAGSDTPPAPDAPRAEERQAPARARRRRPDALAVLSYLFGTLVVLKHLWPRMRSHRLLYAVGDQTVFEWMYAHTAHAIVHGANPFVTRAMNTPDGVNLLANTSMLAFGVLLAPVTLLFGAPVTFAVAQGACLGATASAWYWLWSRHLVSSRLAAWVGGAVCGFAPAMIAQANGHTNMTAQFVLPFLVWGSLRLARSARPTRDGALLGLGIVVQFFVGPELLLDTALALGLFVAVYALNEPGVGRQWRGLATGLSVAAGVAFVLLAYPMYVQFFGHQSYRGISIAAWPGNDLTKLVTPSADTVAGDRTKALRFAMNAVEQNANFGWPLAIGVTTIAVALWRNRLVRTAWICALAFVWCSLGSPVTIHRHETSVSTPWRLLREVPLLDSLLPGRLAMIAVPFIALVLAVAVDAAVAQWRSSATNRDRLGPGAMLLGVALALAPLAPTPLVVAQRPAVPTFIADGTWKRYVGDGRGLVFVPPATPERTEPMAWQSAALMGFSMPGGYFLGPVGPERIGKWPFNDRPTATLLFDVGYHDKSVDVTPEARQAAADDLRLWRADAVVLPDGQQNHDKLLAVVTDLLGPGRRVDDVWLWDVRALTTGP